MLLFGKRVEVSEPAKICFSVYSSQMATRRTALVTLAAGSAAVALAGEMPDHKAHETSSESAAKKAERTPVFFQGRDYETLTRLTDMIIPRTETPGASDVGVPWRIDQAISRQNDLRPLYRNGLDHLNAAAKEHGKQDFLALSEGDQIAVLTAVSESSATPQGEFFQSLKGLTIEWYYNTEPGLARELGFKGNTFRTEFPGCTHPEHWPAQAAEKG
jgi:hypothetical protein